MEIEQHAEKGLVAPHYLVRGMNPSSPEVWTSELFQMDQTLGEIKRKAYLICCSAFHWKLSEVTQNGPKCFQTSDLVQERGTVKQCLMPLCVEWTGWMRVHWSAAVVHQTGPRGGRCSQLLTSAVETSGRDGRRPPRPARGDPPPRRVRARRAPGPGVPVAVRLC